MTTSAPASHVQEAQTLTADALVDLFEITLVGIGTPTVIRFRDGPQITWQGKSYESMACRMTGLHLNSDGEKARPVLTVMNPLGIFNSFVFKGYLDGARVMRRRLLRQHLENNVNINDEAYYYISRVTSLVSDQGITMELRSLTDGPDLMIPARKFMPPEFPFVTI